LAGTDSFFFLKKKANLGIILKTKSNESQNIAKIGWKMEGIVVIRRCPRVLPTHNKTKKKIDDQYSPNIARKNKRKKKDTFPQATLALNEYSLILIFSSTYASAKSSRPRAMAPTKTAILCVVGRVGRYFDKRWVGQSPERARVNSKGLMGEKKGGKEHTYFDCVRRKVVHNWVLRLR
jgi:hypothetical protein